MPLLNCGGSQFSTMLELHFADTRSIVPSGTRLNQCHPFRLSSRYLYIPTLDGTLDTTFEVERTSVPAGFTRACARQFSPGRSPPAGGLAHPLNSELPSDLLGAPLFAMSAKGGCFRPVLLFVFTPFVTKSEISNFDLLRISKALLQLRVQCGSAGR